VHGKTDRDRNHPGHDCSQATGMTFLVLPLRRASLAGWLNSIFIARFTD
jgi:hypothetical protein